MEWSSDEINGATTAAAKDLGFSTLTREQTLVLQTFLSGKDVFVSLPTGSGKSLCYWVLPGAFDMLKKTQCSVVLVVSPLVALMKDQVESLKLRGVNAVYAGEDCDMDRVAEGSYPVIFVSPEALMTKSIWRNVLLSEVYQKHLVAVVIDEAHCVKKWGDPFRKAFSRLSEVRSIIPSHVKLMALTTTATASTRKCVCKILGMIEPSIVAIAPNRPNIHYSVEKRGESMESTFSGLVQELRTKRLDMPRVIIFCRSYEDVGHLYTFMKTSLGQEFVEPIGAPNVARFRLVDMFTACTEKGIKDTIISNFTNRTSPLRLVVATVAFGMGLDSPDVRRIIHWGAPADIESYIQETGRAGRDGEQSSAKLYYAPVNLHPLYTEDSMKQYCLNKETCRRKLLLRDFDTLKEIIMPSPLCTCCDICSLSCKCDKCTAADS